jgi:phosphoribosylformylglycinamidine synthase II
LSSVAHRPLYRALGLTDGEFDRIETLLGRRPNDFELAVFSLLWSEHCGYKHSALLLKRFPTEGPGVLQGPGENAGVVDLGEGEAVAFKVESHNHPSAVEPFQGAATGVGGILRDIVAMGARPIALLDGLRFGKPGFEFGRAVGGIGHYGNCVGVPTVGGDTVFDDAYASNPLVNAMCVGLVPTDRLTRAEAGGPGNHVVLFGATTGRDGIGGASVLASQELSDEDEDKRPSVQVGDPFTGKKLIEASLALVEGGLVQSLQDLGAAGLASSLSEMARGGVGLDVHLDRVPLREADMEPVEIMISESQERMVCVTDQPDAVAKVCARWELEVADIGVVTASGALRVFSDDEVVGEIPAELLTEETPRYRVSTRPRTLQAPISHRPIRPEPAELVDLLRTPSLKSRVSVYRRYDHLVGSRTVRRPGLDAAVLRLRPSHRGLAVSLDGAGRIASLDPQTGGMLAVLEAARNVACAGGKPLALTDCLNFGNPERPEIAWELTETIEGMSLACEALGIPVVSGNVSLYNETDGTAIHPTPVVGCVGLVPDVRHVPGGWQEGDAIYVVGAPDLALDGSEYQARFLGGPAGRPPRPHLGAEAALVRFLWRAAPTLTASHDVSEGGLAIALAELALWSGLGARVELEDDAVVWFGEGGGQAVVACRPEDESALEGMPYRRIGEAGDSKVFGVELEDDAVVWFGEGGGQAVVACRPEDESALEGMPYRRIGEAGGSKVFGVELEDLARAGEFA